MYQRWAVAGTIMAIVVLTLLTGPIGGYTVPNDSPSSLSEPSTATVSVVSAPETVTITQSRYNTGEYYLENPTVVVDVESVTGTPILNYKVTIAELGTAKTAVHAVDELGQGHHRLSLVDASSPGQAQITAINGSDIEQQQYTGRMTLVLRSSTTERVIYDKPVTIQVQ